MTELVSVDWLFQNLDNPDIVILDASLAVTAFRDSLVIGAEVIYNAKYFNLKQDFSDLNSAFPNTVPSPEQFQENCRLLGINKSSRIVVYDNRGVYSSPRVWWLFKVMGHENVQVLDGGLPQWHAQNYPVQSNYNSETSKGDFVASFRSDFVFSYQAICDNVTKKSFTIADARSKGRFDGTENEPRKHLKSGSIPNAVSIPYKEVLDGNKFKTIPELKALFQDKLGQEDNVIFSCGSGLTACIIMLAYEISVNKSMQLYDGSWTEWAELQGLTTES